MWKFGLFAAHIVRHEIVKFSLIISNAHILRLGHPTIVWADMHGGTEAVSFDG